MARQLPPLSPNALLGVAWLEQNALEVRTKYCNEWVAAGASGLVAHNRDLKEVMKEVAAHGLRPEDVTVRFIIPSATA